MSVQHVLDRKSGRSITLSCRATISDVVELLAREKIGTVMMTDEAGKLAGILSERDVVREISASGGAILAMPAETIMTRDVITCTPDASLNDCLTLMSANGIRHLPIVRNSVLAGLVSIRDILDVQAELLIAEIELRKTSENELLHAKEALQSANDSLEDRILSRTDELRREVTERQRAEEALRRSNIALEKRIEELERVKRELEIQGEELVQLSERLRLARDVAEEANRTKTEFFANMSHELRTPLNAIIGFSEVMNTEAFGPVGSPRYRDYATDIFESGQHLLSLINDLLDMSKVESGKEELNETEIDVKEVVTSALRIVRHRAMLKSIDVAVDISPDVPLLWADERKVKQILTNLLTNSIKFTADSGNVAVKVWCRPDSGYVFQVSDDGIGIAPEHITKALSQFGQIDSQVSRENQGTGLGLPLAKSYAEMHSGTLDLQSAVNVGTTVTIRFPASRIRQAVAPRRAGSAAA